MADIQDNKEATGWSGWIYFAGLLMMMVGIFQSIAGLVALFSDTIYVGADGLIVLTSYDQWGWAHLIFGIVLFLSAFSVWAGGTWGRIFGSILAALSAIANFAFITVYPVWSIIVITIDVLIIYALTVHGREARVE